MATATDSDPIDGQLDERTLDYLDRRGWVRAFHVAAWVTATATYPTLAAGETGMSVTLCVFAVVMLLIGRAFSSAGYANAAYNATIGRLTGPIDETAEDMRGDLEWQ